MEGGIKEENGVGGRGRRDRKNKIKDRRDPRPTDQSDFSIKYRLYFGGLYITITHTVKHFRYFPVCLRCQTSDTRVVSNHSCYI